MVRSFLGGRFENTAFCILAPDGEERLSGTGRSPGMALQRDGARGRRGPRPEGEAGHEMVIEAMKKIASKYPAQGESGQMVLQDFHSFRQALNVASGDQRLLLAVAASEEESARLRKSLRPVMSGSEILGRFHVDFLDEEADGGWHDAVEGAGGDAGLYVIRADSFGLEGSVVKSLPLDVDSADLSKALLAANASFAEDESRKVYRDHVRAGRSQGVFFENEMPYGEDRDGDGEIDHRGGRRGPGQEGRPPRRGPRSGVAPRGPRPGAGGPPPSRPR